MTDDDSLVAALSVIQARGAIGEASLSRAIEHAEQYVRAIPADAVRVADLGSGGGLPGLVIAVRRPELHLVLVERRATRADLLRRAVASLYLADRVEVLADDVKVLARRSPAGFDCVTARSFAAPAITAHWAAALLKTEGLLIVSEPPEPDPDRWPAALLADEGLADLGRIEGVRRLRRTSSAA
jgi:16S rRNA (guanine527-N7)-methyltransferase